MITAEMEKVFNEHCSKHKNCIGCQFVGGACVAPVSENNFSEWNKKMYKLIKAKK
jgi:hypothetical protein